MLSVDYVPPVLEAIMPDQAGAILKRMTEWIATSSRMIENATDLDSRAMHLGKHLTVPA